MRCSPTVVLFAFMIAVGERSTAELLITTTLWVGCPFKTAAEVYIPARGRALLCLDGDKSHGD